MYQFCLESAPYIGCSCALQKVNCLVAHAQDRHFVIYDLYFDCVYVVRLQDDADRVSGHVLVTTPPCDHVTVVGDVTPDCPPKGRRIMEFDVLHS